jgi:signal transduction histidine kinase
MKLLEPAGSDPSLLLQENLSQKIHLDNLFRLALSLVTFALVAWLWAFHQLAQIRPLLILVLGYGFLYSIGWIAAARGQVPAWLDYFFHAVDIAAITLCIRFTGGSQSLFFYLYTIPFLVAAFHFDFAMVVWNGLLSIAAYLALLGALHELSSCQQWIAHAGQLVFLGVLVATAIATVRLLRLKEKALQKSVQTMSRTVTFLHELGTATIEQPAEALRERIVQRLNYLLKPTQTYARLWVANESWKTLGGVGEHPALRPGSPSHLPMSACPAWSLRRPFSYCQRSGDSPCPGEQFDYPAHACLPVATDKECYGVLFLGTYHPTPWDSDDFHFFGVLAESIAFILQRKALLERLQEKISDLNFSFEVGASSLATFVGSTHSLDETTLHILDSVLSILKADRTSLMLWDPIRHCLQTQWARGGNFKVQTPLSLAWGEGMAGWALKTGEPYWAEYALGDPHYKPSAQPIKSLLCVPIFTMGRTPLGVINVVTQREARTFRSREIDFLKAFGQRAALAIENAQLHERNRANIEQLRELDKMKSQFLSLVSHDLRGPLTGIQGFCELLRKHPLTQAQEGLLAQLERQLELQQRMVDDLLDLARMERGQFSIHPRSADLVALLKEEVEKSQAEATERRITLALCIPPESLSRPVHMDEGRIRQVIWNLVHNALKFTPEGGRITVEARFEEEWCHVLVSDSGVGLPVDAQDRIFDKFFQVTPGGSKGSQGLGLGLTICKEIVSSHGGTIQARSPGLGQGTTISFTLPAAHPASADASASPLAA